VIICVKKRIISQYYGEVVMIEDVKELIRNIKTKELAGADDSPCINK
jgi:hypothetical protein